MSSLDVEGPCSTCKVEPVGGQDEQISDQEYEYHVKNELPDCSIQPQISGLQIECHLIDVKSELHGITQHAQLSGHVTGCTLKYEKSDQDISQSQKSDQKSRYTLEVVKNESDIANSLDIMKNEPDISQTQMLSQKTRYTLEYVKSDSDITLTQMKSQEISYTLDIIKPDIAQVQRSDDEREYTLGVKS